MSSRPIARFVSAATKVEPHEFRATVLSFVFVFASMAGYFILRPVRDAMTSEFTDVELSSLWTSTFVFSAIAISAYGAIIPHVRFDRLVPAVYAFFAATFIAFYFGEAAIPDAVWLDRVFYVWISIFSLFHLSVFWSFMSGIYNREQAPRLFAIIATGASAGALAGSSLVTFFAPVIGTLNLMLIAAVLFVVPVPLSGILQRLKATDLGNAELEADLSKEIRLGKNPFSGFMLVLGNRYLLGIAAFMLLYVAMNTFFYFEFRDLVRPFERELRQQWWGGVDLVINVLAIATALFGTGRLAMRFGMSVTLGLLPALLVIGWLLVAVAPTMMVLVTLQVLRRAGNYAITRPAREMLYTLVDAESRYKAKPVNDVVVYRGGDMATAWAYTGVTAALGLGLTGVAVMAAIVAAVWGLSATWLGRFYNAADGERGAAVAPAQP